jgi:hypothetical protein
VRRTFVATPRDGGGSATRWPQLPFNDAVKSNVGSGENLREIWSGRLNANAASGHRACSPMVFAFVYSLLRLLLDLVDVRLRVHDLEAELLLLRHQLRVVRR